MVLRLIGKRHSSILVINTLTGVIEGGGPLAEKHQRTGEFALSGRWLFLMNGNRLTRLRPEPAGTLLGKFEQYVANGDVEEADKLHAQVLPFVDELPVAAKIHRMVVGQSYKAMAKTMRSGTFAATLRILMKLSQDKNMLYFEDLRAFVLQIKEQLEAHDLGVKLRAADQKRVAALARRQLELLGRFDKQLQSSADEDFMSANRQVLFALVDVMSKNSQRWDAALILVDMWNAKWCIHPPELETRLRLFVVSEVRTRISALATAVSRGKNQQTALKGILEIPGYNIVIRHARSIEDLPKMTPSDFAAELSRLRREVNP